VKRHKEMMFDLMSEWSPVPWHIRWRERLRVHLTTVNKIYSCPECTHDW
jgi:hypothetical protein